MDRATAQQLIELNNRFYQGNAQSFSATRQAPWRGWEHVVATVRAVLPPEKLDGTDTLRVLDLACGNMRLLDYLLSALPAARIVYYAVDGEPELLACARRRNEHEQAARTQAHALQYDILGALLSALDAPSVPNQPVYDSAGFLWPTSIPPCDLVCCFGFMHHVPGKTLRRALVELLVAQTQPGGVAALSCWRFLDDPRIAAQARAVTAYEQERYPQLALEPHDYLLGWQGNTALLRYCHYLDERELDELVCWARKTGARELDRFSADGRIGHLNRYSVLQRGEFDNNFVM